MKEISLTQNLVTLVDDADYSWLIAYKWYAHEKTGRIGDAIYWEALAQVNKKKTKMHRLILQAPSGILVDHIDGNGLNNQRDNLRLCTHQENQYNRRKSTPHSSLYKGVHWNTQKQKWCAQIFQGGKKVHLGFFTDEKKAAREAGLLFGEFASLNFERK